MKVDRDSAATAARVIERLLLEPTSRRVCLAMLADAIDIAHDCGDRCWGITLGLDGSYVRLNAGQVEVVVLHQEDVFLLLDGPTLGEVERRDLADYLKPITDDFVLVPGEKVRCNLPSEKLAAAYPKLASAHRRFIERAAPTKKIYPFRRAFSPGVLRYLADELDRAIPWPGYANDTPSPESDTPMILSDDDCSAFLTDLGDLNDIRQAPDARRRGQFRTGWQEATERGVEYTADTLKRLTWRNLGYRLGEKWGMRSAAEIDEVYEQFARYFQTIDSPTTTSTSPDNWLDDVRAWTRHHRRQVPDGLADELVTFFALCFEYNRCPDHAWFGISDRAVSLVVGGLYLGALNFNSKREDRGLWLLLDRSFDDIPGMDFRVVKSTRGDSEPLIWGHLAVLEHLPALHSHAYLWASHAAASARIMDFPISRARDEAFHRRNHRHRLAEFWSSVAAPALPDLPAISQALEAEGTFDPTSIKDARQRIERAIVQRQGQSKFRGDLLEKYDRRCPITGCDLPAALEAAHIIPYKGKDTNDVANGLLLRADIHTLFDLYLLTIHPESRKVVIAPELQGSCYAELEGKELASPKQRSGPAQGALEEHYREFLGRWRKN